MSSLEKIRIGVDFDNTIICYDEVFVNLARSLKIVSFDFQGTKQSLRRNIQMLTDGDLIWQKMQGKVYGELINQAHLFPGFKEFVQTCNAKKEVELFIVSHKTEFGHFDDKRINLRIAAQEWLQKQGFFELGIFHIPEHNIFFEKTREEKIERIKHLKCTHFIDDLTEVFDSQLFPKNIEQFLFRAESENQDPETTRIYSNWEDIKNALFFC